LNEASEAGFGAETTRSEALFRLVETFRRSALDEPQREARLTLCAAADLSPAALIASPETPLGAAAARLDAFAMRRASGEPLSRIIGAREFWGLALAISPDVLDPRPESETLVEAALALFDDKRREPLRLLDLGVGSGALLCALLRDFPHARGLGVDLSPPAVEVASANAQACGFAERADIRVGSWTVGLEGPFDLIVSNPPYIPSGDVDRLPPEVRLFDPRLALDGGTDGLDAYRAIFPAAAPLIAQGGWLLAEIGLGQAESVLAVAAKAGFAGCAILRDLAGRERVIAAPSPQGAPGPGDHAGGDRGERVNALG
jgi:release factor glutamine methyltransferase